MDSVRQNNAYAALMSLEAAAVSARGGFGCLFSSSDEYETALIEQRRAHRAATAAPMAAGPP
jgi:hypothetical protein